MMVVKRARTATHNLRDVGSGSSFSSFHLQHLRAGGGSLVNGRSLHADGETRVKCGGFLIFLICITCCVAAADLARLAATAAAAIA